MSMSKKDFIALADEIRYHNRMAANADYLQTFTTDQLELLASFCKRQNGNFMKDRWFGYIDGECGPNGGATK